MSRLPDATVRLAALISDAQNRRFRWGFWDCCQFGARDVHAITGRDPREVFPRYRTRAEAEAVIANCGGLDGLTRKALAEYPQILPSRATFGDIVLCDFGRGPQPAVCGGVYCFAPRRIGLDKRMTLDATAAWKI
jgi:hypothetical protein